MGQLHGRRSLSDQCIPNNGETTANCTEDAGKHGTDGLGCPSQHLRIGSDIETAQIRGGVMAGSIACEWCAELSTLIVHKLRWLDPLLRNGRCLEEGERQTSLQVPLNVAMEEPGSRVVGDKSHRYGSTWWDLDCVSPQRVGQTFLHRRVKLWIVRGNIPRLVDDGKLVAVQVEWMFSGIPVDHLEFKDLVVLENSGVWPINIHIFGISAHAQLREETWHDRSIPGDWETVIRTSKPK